MKVSKSIIFLVNSFLGSFYRHLAIFSGHTGCVSKDSSFKAPDLIEVPGVDFISKF